MLPITVADLVKRKTYTKEKPYSTYLNCHIGHRKLLNVVLEFLIECQKKKIDPNDSFIIYIGSAPGISINVIDILYPNITWLLYDTNQFIITRQDNKIYRKKYFSDDEIKVARNDFKKSGKKHFLFISDIRELTGDENIYADLIVQQRWIVKLEVDGFSVKFRMPYVMDNIKNKEDILNEIKDLKKSHKKIFQVDDSELNDFKNNINNRMLYLNGNIFIQTYAPMTSTETRLISFGPYKMKSYDINDYDEKMFYFNIYDRVKTNYVYGNSKKYLFLNNYDEVREFQIFDSYNKINKKYKNIKEMYDMIYEIFNKYTIHNMYSCKINMFLRFVNRVNTNTDKTLTPYLKQLFVKLFKDIKTIINKINDRMKKKKLRNIKLALDNDIFKKIKNKINIDMELLDAVKGKLT